MAGPASQTHQPRSIWTRKIDMFYVFFLSLLCFFPIIFDFVAYSPVPLPSWATAPYEFFRQEYNDPVYSRDPPFFKLYVFLEVVYLVPMGLWCIRGLIKDSAMVPLHCLVLATHVTSSTAVCLVELLGTEDWPQEYIEKNKGGYVVFLIVSTLMLVDMFLRVRAVFTAKLKAN